MDANTLKLLIVDDDPDIVALLSVLAESLGAQVDTANCGEQALEKIHHCRPDLVLLDVIMPGLSGFEVSQQLKASPQIGNTPFLFITAASDVEREVQGLELGAVDFISKPIEPLAALARLSTHMDLQRNQKELQNKNFILSEEKLQLEEMVTKMRSAFPIEKQHLRYIMRSLDKTAGDILLSNFTPDGLQQVLVGDFSGHGLPAAFSGILVPYIFHKRSAAGWELAQTLAEINQVLHAQLPTQLYMAVAAVEIDAERKLANLWNFGLPPLQRLSRQQPYSRLRSMDLPLGIISTLDTHLPHQRLELHPGDSIYAYSDGITEASNPEGEEFGEQQLKSLLTEIHQRHLPLTTIWDTLNDFCQHQPLSDDALMVEIHG